jgi:hypothetical protein
VTAASLPPQPCGSGGQQGCYTSFVVAADLDADGAFDLLFANGGGYYTKGAAQPALFYRNLGAGKLDDASLAALGGPSSRLRQLAVGDIDGDGDLDVYMPGGYGVDPDRLLVQGPGGVFDDQASTRLPAGLASRAGAAHLGDVDGDGDLDLLVTDWGAAPLADPGGLALYLNDGDGTFSPASADALPAPLAASVGNTPIDLDLADVDGDLDLDVLVNHRNGLSRLLVNDGAGRFAEAPFPAKQGPYAYNTEACDIDGDGDLDLLIDNAAGGLGQGHRTQVLINDGAGAFDDQTALRVAGEPNTDDNIVKCADIDADGDMDLVVGSLEAPAEKLLVNDGSGHFQVAAGAFPDASDPTLGLDVADLDGDGVLDVATGQGEGTPRLNRVYRGVGGAVDGRPPTLRAIEALPAVVPSGNSIVLRLAVTDAHTSETGQHVASVSVAWSAGELGGEVAARFVGGDVFRAVIPPQPAGAHLLLAPGSRDRLGNQASFPVISLDVAADGGAGGGGGSPGSTGEGGAGGQAGAGAGGAGDGGSAGAGQPEAGGGQAGQAGSTGQATPAGPAGGEGGDTGGCACSTAQQGSTWGGRAGGFLWLLALGRRCRRDRAARWPLFRS